MNTHPIRSALVGTLCVALALASGSVSATSFRLTDLGTLGGSSSGGAAINASGQVTGSSDGHAFLWDGTTMLYLNALIDPADPLQPFVRLEEGVDINDRGQILVNGFDSRINDFRAYVLSPIVTVPEPGSLALLGLGLLGLGLTRRRAN